MGKRIVAGLLLTMVLLTVAGTASAAPHKVVRWGSRGADVRRVQRILSGWRYYRGPIDGVYGRLMYSAVVNFQRKNGLRADGVVGAATWTALGDPMRTGVRPPARGGTDRGVRRGDDLELLAKVVSAEAKGESYEGQVAVAAVILNRVRDSRFPNTLAGVIYQTHAFESVSNGEIYRPVATTSRGAARDALNGWDPSGGAVFFWNPSKPVSGWIWSRPIIKRIGNHVFAR